MLNQVGMQGDIQWLPYQTKGNIEKKTISNAGDRSKFNDIRMNFYEASELGCSSNKKRELAYKKI